MQVTDIAVTKENRESTRHGSAAFPIAVYYSIMSKNILGYTKLHWHEEIQFCLVVRGAIEFHVSEQTYRLERGDGIFINSSYLHMARPLRDPDSTYICMDLGPQLLSGFTGSIIEQQYLLPFLSDAAFSHCVLRQQVDWQKAVLDEIRWIYKWNEEQPLAYEVEIFAHLQIMFLSLLRHRPDVPIVRRKSKANIVVQRIISYIGQHYQEKITLQDIAGHASYAESECCRIFKKFTGDSIFSYLRAFRLEQSTYLLTRSTISVSDIAYTCGFSSTSYYIEAFRKQFSLTPLCYRQQHEIK
ncbi:MAG: AraC family transcriptional regulator [Megasphaera sp.]|nr:AraC family transcriptional regulator [Megasphaera sp.]